MSYSMKCDVFSSQEQTFPESRSSTYIITETNKPSSSLETRRRNRKLVVNPYQHQPHHINRPTRFKDEENERKEEKLSENKKRKEEKRSDNKKRKNERSSTNWCEYVIVIMLTAVLLIVALALTIFWVMYYREGFSWDENPELQFNYHPVLMVAGFIFLSGYAILFYRICRCCKWIYVKLFHAIFHVMAIPCIVVGFIAVYKSHNNSDPPIPNFDSIHSWLGCITMGLFAIQFVLGFIFFVILRHSTTYSRASCHSAFGLCTFMLAIATCLTGLNETITLFGSEEEIDIAEQTEEFRINMRSRFFSKNRWSSTYWYDYVIVIMLTGVLLIVALALTIFWVMSYREGFLWDENPELQFNLHPVLMVAGFIFLSGYAILSYRICRCFRIRRIYVKLFHMIFHAIAIPCFVVGFLAVYESHNNSDPPIPNFDSIHSWLGCLTMGLFAIQFVLGFFFFVIPLRTKRPRACFRASLVPFHSAFGLCTFMLAIATCLTGLNETITLFGSKEEIDIAEQTEEFRINMRSTEETDIDEQTEEFQLLKGLALVFAALLILVTYIFMRENFRTRCYTRVISPGKK